MVIFTPLFGLNLTFVRGDLSADTGSLLLSGKLNITNVKSDSGVYKQGDEADVYITVSSNQTSAYVLAGAALIKEGVSGKELSEYAYYYPDIDNSYWTLNFINGLCTIKLPDFPIPTDLPLGKYFFMAGVIQLIELPTGGAYLGLVNNYVNLTFNGTEFFEPYDFLNQMNEVFDDAKLATSFHPSNTFQVIARPNPVSIDSINRSQLVVTNGDTLDIIINTSKQLDDGDLNLDISIIDYGGVGTGLLTTNTLAKPIKVYQTTQVISQGQSSKTIQIPILNWKIDMNAFVTALNTHIPDIYWASYEDQEYNYYTLPTELFPQNLSNIQQTNVTLNSSFLQNVVNMWKINQAPNMLTLQIKSSSDTYGTDLFTTFIPFCPTTELFNNTFVQTDIPVITTFEDGVIKQDGKLSFEINGTCDISDMTTSKNNKFDVYKSLFGIGSGLIRNTPTGEIFYGGSQGGFAGVAPGGRYGPWEGLTDNKSVRFSLQPSQNVKNRYSTHIGFTDTITALMKTTIIYDFSYYRGILTSLPEGKYWICVFTAYYAGPGALEVGYSTSNPFQVTGESKNHVKVKSCSMSKDKYIASDNEYPIVSANLTLSPYSTSNELAAVVGYSFPYHNFEEVENLIENYSAINADIYINNWVGSASAVQIEKGASEILLSGGCSVKGGGSADRSKTYSEDENVLNLTFPDSSGAAFEVQYNVGSLPFDNLTYWMFKSISKSNSSNYETGTNKIYIYNFDNSLWEHSETWSLSSSYYYHDYYYGPYYYYHEDLRPYVSDSNIIRIKYEIQAKAPYEGIEIKIDRLWFEYKYAKYLPPLSKAWELNNASMKFLDLGANIYNSLVINLDDDKTVEIPALMQITNDWEVQECLTAVYYYSNLLSYYSYMYQYYYYGIEDVNSYKWEEVGALCAFTIVKHDSTSVKSQIINLEEELNIRLTAMTGTGLVDVTLDPSLMYGRYAMPDDLMSTGIFYKIILQGTVGIGTSSLIRVHYDQDELIRLGFNILTMTLLIYDAPNKKWTALTDTSIDIVSGTITASFDGETEEIIVGIGAYYANVAVHPDYFWIIIIIIISIIGAVSVAAIFFVRWRKGKSGYNISENTSEGDYSEYSYSF